MPHAAAAGGGTLLQGQLDEAAEAKAFQEAVASWRAGAADATKVSCYTCYRVFVPAVSTMLVVVLGGLYCNGKLVVFAV